MNMKKDKYCITVSGTTNEEVWREIRSILGPTNIDTSVAIDRMNNEISYYNDWVSENGYVPFDKWLIWFIRIGTTRYGNLPEDKKGKDVGHCYAPCPYSTQSTDLRTRHMLNLKSGDPLPTKVDHEVGGVTYYMKTGVRGNKWGYECTFPGCTYFITNGNNYFYI